MISELKRAERERERARRETRESEIGLVPSSSDHHLKPRCAVELVLARSSHEIMP